LEAGDSSCFVFHRDYELGVSVLAGEQPIAKVIEDEDHILELVQLNSDD